MKFEVESCLHNLVLVVWNLHTINDDGYRYKCFTLLTMLTLKHLLFCAFYVHFCINHFKQRNNHHNSDLYDLYVIINDYVNMNKLDNNKKSTLYLSVQRNAR